MQMPQKAMFLSALRELPAKWFPNHGTRCRLQDEDFHAIDPRPIYNGPRLHEPCFLRYLSCRETRLLGHGVRENYR